MSLRCVDGPPRIICDHCGREDQVSFPGGIAPHWLDAGKARPGWYGGRQDGTRFDLCPVCKRRSKADLEAEITRLKGELVATQAASALTVEPRRWFTITVPCAEKPIRLWHLSGDDAGLRPVVTLFPGDVLMVGRKEP